ncbi:MAG: hypothetical protein H5T64_11965 [Chloroflexi bacterium]|nr:hypothetical protein [Chloroflexota bacterium]
MLILSNCRLYLRQLVIFLCVLSLLLLKGSNLVGHFYLQMGLVLWTKALLSERNCSLDPAKVAKASHLLQYSLTAHEASMGIQQAREMIFELEKVWQTWQPGARLIEDFRDLKSWREDSLNNVSWDKGDFDTNGDVATMHFTNDVSKRDIFVFHKSTWVQIGDNCIMGIRLRASADTLYTIELVEDGQRRRVVSYQPGTGEWIVVEAGLTGNELQEITLGVSEHEPIEHPAECYLLLDWIALR